MNINETIKILEALASGCSPLTGEIINNDSILNERDVIRALEKAITELERIDNSKNESIEPSVQKNELNIDEDDVNEAIKLFQEVQHNPTYARLMHFFLKSKKFEYPILNSSNLYGKYFGYYTKKDLLNYFKNYLPLNGFSLHGKVKKPKEIEPWESIDFFQSNIFNKLTEKGIEQLKSKINEIGIEKNDNLSDFLITARKKHFRAFEKWTDPEKELLMKALNYTNDLVILSDCFQRGKGSIESCGKRIIYEQKSTDNNS